MAVPCCRDYSQEPFPWLGWLWVSEETKGSTELFRHMTQILCILDDEVRVKRMWSLESVLKLCPETSPRCPQSKPREETTNKPHSSCNNSYEGSLRAWMALWFLWQLNFQNEQVLCVLRAGKGLQWLFAFCAHSRPSSTPRGQWYCLEVSSRKLVIQGKFSRIVYTSQSVDNHLETVLSWKCHVFVWIAFYKAYRQIYFYCSCSQSVVCDPFGCRISDILGILGIYIMIHSSSKITAMK